MARSSLILAGAHKKGGPARGCEGTAHACWHPAVPSTWATPQEEGTLLRRWDWRGPGPKARRHASAGRPPPARALVCDDLAVTIPLRVQPVPHVQVVPGNLCLQPLAQFGLQGGARHPMCAAGLGAGRVQGNTPPCPPYKEPHRQEPDPAALHSPPLTAITRQAPHASGKALPH